MTATSSLAEHFAGAAGKYLSAVEAQPVRSNQHEFNGVTALRGLLGDPPAGGRTFSADFVFLDDDMEPLVVYPYHYRNSNGSTGNAITFKNLMSTDFGIEVRLRQWY